MEKGFVVRKAQNGLGVFAQKSYAKDETLFPVKGVFISCNEEEDFDEKTRSNTYRFDEERFLSPAGELGDFLNHSCTPNAKVVKRKGKLLIITVSSLPKETEILIDYSTIIASDDVWKMKCRCGAKHCRKIIANFSSLPKSLQKRYRAEHIVPSYIVKI